MLKIQNPKKLLLYFIRYNRNSPLVDARCSIVMNYIPYEYVQYYPSQDKHEFIDNIEVAKDRFFKFLEKAKETAIKPKKLIDHGRNIQKLEAYLYLLSQEELLEEIKSINYEPNGLPIIQHVCQKLQG